MRTAPLEGPGHLTEVPLRKRPMVPTLHRSRCSQLTGTASALSVECSMRALGTPQQHDAADTYGRMAELPGYESMARAKASAGNRYTGDPEGGKGSVVKVGTDAPSR